MKIFLIVDTDGNGIASFTTSNVSVMDYSDKSKSIEITSLSNKQDILNNIQKYKAIKDKTGEKIELLEKISAISVQKVGFKRYNPFTETGGDQSFTLLLLDRSDNGIALSSLYTREGVRMYGKRIEGGKPLHPLSEEEKNVLDEIVRKPQ